jgi:hypothetical protein
VLVVLQAFSDWTWVAIVRHLLAAAFIGYAVNVMLRFILTSSQVTFNIVFASLCRYLLLGVLWALGNSTRADQSPIRRRFQFCRGAATNREQIALQVRALGYAPACCWPYISSLVAQTTGGGI